MLHKNLIDEFKKRGCIAQLTDEKGLLQSMFFNSITLYCGFDITADSLHIGHILPLLCLKRFQMSGHKPIVLLGEATSLIGDPSFKNIERKLNNLESVILWKENIRKQISGFLDFNCGINSAEIVNNKDWFDSINILNFLRDIGKYFSVNKMINRESVKKRVFSSNQGISFTEFSYNLLQAYDFMILHKKYSVTLQIGGSDQWGNIASGIFLTRRLLNKTVFGLTLPLLIQDNGVKFGKTETGTIWLDPKKTSPYKFYQFWINRSDTEILNFLKMFTFLSLKEIKDIKVKNIETNDIYSSRKILAESVTRLVHGAIGVSAAKRISSFLFSKSLNSLTLSDFQQLKQDGIPFIKLSGHEDLQQALVNAALSPSRGQARNMIFSGAIHVNNKIQKDMKYCFRDSDKIFQFKHNKTRNYCGCGESFEL
ncbi:MAG TPA: tyrosine--tRNA ligase [Buchnera sp. (in: enterobacteria)]|nr:tyrosine--tRNA ligase [Buchnera sp. (in: enterobacteria)]